MVFRGLVGNFRMVELMETNELVIKDNYDIEYKGFKLHSTGLEATGAPTFEQWEEVGRFLKKSNKCVQFWIGDWLNYGESRWGEKYAQALDELDYTYGGLRNIAWVSNSVGLSRRFDELSFEHHQEVASLKPAEQELFLRRAASEELSAKELRRVIKEGKRTLSIRKTGHECEICSEWVKLVFDHDHVKGYMRGVLCDNCNKGIGMFKDSVSRLERAIAYLKKYS